MCRPASIFVLATLSLLACTTTSTRVTPNDADTTAPEGVPDQTKLPRADAADLGDKCSGFGTGIGETALFQEATCGAGFCLVDATTFDEYCSADCAVNACPIGYTCKAVDHPRNRYGCFKDPNTTTSPDAATPAGPFDTELDGYEANAETRTKIKLRDHQDATRSTHDLIFITAIAPWSGPSTRMTQVLSQSKDAKVDFIDVLVQFDDPEVGATVADLDTFHEEQKPLTVVLDPNLKTLSPVLGPLTAVPTWAILDAKTLETLVSELGATSSEQELNEKIAKARAKLK